MQAVYALMDWLGRQLSGIGDKQSVWADLAAPAEMTESWAPALQDRRARQRAAADVLDEVLDGGWPGSGCARTCAGRWAWAAMTTRRHRVCWTRCCGTNPSAAADRDPHDRAAAALRLGG